MDNNKITDVSERIVKLFEGGAAKAGPTEYCDKCEWIRMRPSRRRRAWINYAFYIGLCLAFGLPFQSVTVTGTQLRSTAFGYYWGM